MLVLNIGASLLAFYAFIKFLDDVVLWFGHFAGWDKLSFSYILGYILYPVAFLIGIEGKVCEIQNTMFVKKIKHLCAGLQSNWRTDWTENSDHRVSSISEFSWLRRERRDQPEILPDRDLRPVRVRQSPQHRDSDRRVRCDGARAEVRHCTDRAESHARRMLGLIP